MISIHALLAESDHRSCTFAAPLLRFLSTLSLRRATRLFLQPYGLPPIFLSTLSLRRATSRLALALITSKHFYPRSPYGERPNGLFQFDRRNRISIHALLTESDLAGPSGPAFLYNFYPRSPYGERRHPKTSSHPHNTFLSTLSLRRATLMWYQCNTVVKEFLSTLSLRRATTTSKNR